MLATTLVYKFKDFGSTIAGKAYNEAIKDKYRFYSLYFFNLSIVL